VEKILAVKKIFLDCDIIIDFITGRQPFAHTATMLFSLAEKGKIVLTTSSLTFSHLFYLLRKAVPAQSLRDILKKLTYLVEPLAVEGATIRMALNSEFRDFEDAIQECTARAAGVPILITRNTRDYRKSALTVKTPEEYLQTL
jgi:predicted nucleic acid-binding protein